MFYAISNIGIFGIVVGIVVVLLIVGILWRNKKPSMEAALAEDRALIAENAKTMAKMQVILQDNAYIFTKLESLKGSYKHSSPKHNPKTIQVDKKIKDALIEMETCTKRAIRKDDCSDIDELIRKIQVLIAER